MADDDEAAAAGGDVGQVDGRAKAAGPAEHHVAVAGVGFDIARRVAALGADDQVVEAVAVDVAGGGDRAAGQVAGILADDDEAAAAGGDVGQVDGRAKAAGPAEHHVAVAGVGFDIARRVAALGADDQVVEAVAVDVAGRGDRDAGPVVAILAEDCQTAAAGGDGCQVDGRAKAARLAEDHVAVAGVIGLDIARRVAARRADDQVVEAVAVDVAGRRDRDARIVAGILAEDDEAAAAGGDAGQVDGCAEAARLAEHYVAVAGIALGIVRRVAVPGADDQVVEAVAVDVAGGGDREAG